MSTGFDLPEDVILEIMCRLPVRSLIRFTCVSKRWRFIILSDPQFAKSHLQLALQQRALTQRLFITNHPVVKGPDYGDGFTRQFQSWEDSYNGSVIELTAPSEEQLQRVVTSCNGLVLLGDSYVTGLVHLAIWNPSTGFFRKIPCPRMKGCGERQYLEFVIYGFGYVSATDDYKLVFVIPGDSTHFCVYIFSLRANCWKSIEAPHSSSACCNHEAGTLANGAIHWSSRRPSESMYAFDLAEEKVREMPLPVWFANARHKRVLLGGCLCVGFKTEDGRGSEIWGMTEYAVPDSWVKLFGFRECDLPDVFASLTSGWDLCFVTEGGTVVIKLFDSYELVRFECRKDEKLVCTGRYLLEVPGTRSLYNRCLYDETLVSIPE